jgi:hypothetical protein
MRDHVLGRESRVQQSLLEKGEFPQGWVETYLQLLKEAAVAWHNQTCLPRELVAAVHFASWYLDLRYKTWCKFSGGRNTNTECELARIRTPSETFLMMSVIKDLTPSTDPSAQRGLDSIFGLQVEP